MGVRNSNMEMSLADQDGAITILATGGPAGQDLLGASPALPTRKPRSQPRAGAQADVVSDVDGRDRGQAAEIRRQRPQGRLGGFLSRPRLEPAQRRAGGHRRRHGRGDERRRLPHPRHHAAAVGHRPAVHGRPEGQPDVARIIAGAFDLSHLPNRAELRLKSTGKVIGYTHLAGPAMPAGA